jgi:hypothetical protein
VRCCCHGALRVGVLAERKLFVAASVSAATARRGTELESAAQAGHQQHEIVIKQNSNHRHEWFLII